jgi:hypothetical protein
MENLRKMLETRRMFAPLKLQLFAEGGEGDGEGGDGDKGDGDKNKETKTYTQEELNAIAKKEKESGKKAILKELGIEDVKSVKDSLAKLKEWQDSQKSDTEKAQAALAEKEKAADEASKKAALLEAKLDAIKAGVNPKFVDDAIVLAMTKITDNKDLAAVLEDMKKTYPNFFSETEEEDTKGASGTGSKVTGKKGKAEVVGIGERLAKKNQGTGTAKSSYFTK